MKINKSDFFIGVFWASIFVSFVDLAYVAFWDRNEFYANNSVLISWMGVFVFALACLCAFLALTTKEAE